MDAPVKVLDRLDRYRFAVALNIKKPCAHPFSHEAGRSRMQIGRIANVASIAVTTLTTDKRQYFCMFSWDMMLAVYDHHIDSLLWRFKVTGLDPHGFPLSVSAGAN